MLLHAIVHPADIQDRDGGILVMATLFGMFPFLKKLFADGGYQGPEFNQALARMLPHLKAEIVKRSDQAEGFVVLERALRPNTFAAREKRLAEQSPRSRNPPRKDRNGKNRRSETGPRQPNPRECRGFSHTGK